jgi:hypothetical protein
MNLPLEAKVTVLLESTIVHLHVATQSSDAGRIETDVTRMRADLGQYGNSKCSDLGQYGKFPYFVAPITWKLQ